MDGDRLEIAKEAAEAVLNTTSNNDFIGVISFNENASTIHIDRIVRGTSENKKPIIKAVQDLSSSGSTNYEAAIRLGFSMLEAAQ